LKRFFGGANTCRRPDYLAMVRHKIWVKARGNMLP
jgi:hypothetical protein